MRVFPWVVGLVGVVVLMGMADLLFLENPIPGEKRPRSQDTVTYDELGSRWPAAENKPAVPSVVTRRGDLHAALSEQSVSSRAKPAIPSVVARRDGSHAALLKSSVSTRVNRGNDRHAATQGTSHLVAPTTTQTVRQGSHLADDYRCQPLPSPHQDRCGPWFINIGVYKAATRQVLIDLDRCHPEVVRPEPPENARGWFWEPSMWGTQLRERDFQRYLPLIGDVHPGDFTVTGEKSPDYFFLKQSSIRRLKRLLPLTKIFVIIREPGERLFSHFLMKMRQEAFRDNHDLSIHSPDEIRNMDTDFEKFLADSYREAGWATPFKSIRGSSAFLEAVAAAEASGELLFEIEAPRLRDETFFFGWDYMNRIGGWAQEFPLNSQLLVVLFEQLTQPDEFPGGVDRLVEFLELSHEPGVAKCFKDQGDVKHHEKMIMSPLSRRFLSAIFRPSVDALNNYLRTETDVNVDSWYDKMYPS